MSGREVTCPAEEYGKSYEVEVEKTLENYSLGFTTVLKL